MRRYKIVSDLSYNVMTHAGAVHAGAEHHEHGVTRMTQADYEARTSAFKEEQRRKEKEERRARAEEEMRIAKEAAAEVRVLRNG